MVLYYLWYWLGYDVDNDINDSGGKTADEIIENIKKVEIPTHSKEILYASVIEELKKKLKLID